MTDKEKRSKEMLYTESLEIMRSALERLREQMEIDSISQYNFLVDDILSKITNPPKDPIEGARLVSRMATRAKLVSMILHTLSKSPENNAKCCGDCHIEDNDVN